MKILYEFWVTALLHYINIKRPSMSRSARVLPILILAFISSNISEAQPPLLDKSVVASLDGEISGESAKRNLEYVSRLHRMRGSAQFRAAIDFIAVKLKEYGLEEVEVFEAPADGKSMYGTQKSRLVWEAEFAELWELDKNGERTKRIADWESMPVTLAEDSESGDVTAELIDVGAGTSEKDYENKDVKGKLVLISSSPGSAVELAIRKGAVGLISYTQNQVTAWWKEDENLIRWGHFESFTDVKSFCFMISLKQARDFQSRLSHGEKVSLHAKVKAGQHPGSYSFATAVIKGANPKLKEEEIAFSCHLDHQRPGANDNASGSMTILEIARTMKKLIDEGKLTRPQRTLRFIWSPEIEGTAAVLSQRPAYAKNIKANIHMDMVGGGQVTKAVFHVAGAPKSLPSFVADVGQVIGTYVNEQTDAFAGGTGHEFKFVSNEGGKEPLLAILGEFHMGSDHDVYQEGGFRIPSVYMHDWPDRYIHTNGDVPANIDPTKLKRAGFIGAASGYFLANINEDNVAAMWNGIKQQTLKRMALMLEHSRQLSKDESANLMTQHFRYERDVFNSMKGFAVIPVGLAKEADVFYSGIESAVGKQKAVAPKTKPAGIVYKRNMNVKGPLFVFGYDYLEDHLGAEKEKALRLLSYQGLWGSEYSYEGLNFVDGVRTTNDIRDALSAEFGPVPLDVVEEYLKALEEIGLIMK
jgi:aminopeptidase YwaD